MAKYTFVFRKLLFSILILLVTQGAYSFDNRDAFLQLYLDNPYSKLRTADHGFNGDIHWNYQGQPLTRLIVNYPAIHFIVGANGRADLVVPVGYATAVNAADMKAHILVFHNSENLIPVAGAAGTSYQHWDPNADVQDDPSPPNYIPAGSIIVCNCYLPMNLNPPMAPFGADLNGDGLTDNGNIILYNPSGAFNGILLNINNVALNVGYGSVRDQDLAMFLRDTRLGYIASFANTALSNADLNSVNDPTGYIASAVSPLNFSASKVGSPLPDEMDFGICTRQSFIPNLYSYQLGVKLGIKRGYAYLTSLKSATEQINGYQKKMASFTANQSMTQGQVDQLTTDVNGIGIAAASKYGPNLQSLDIFQPRLFDEHYNNVRVQSQPAPVMGANAVRILFQSLDKQVLVPTKVAGHQFFNSSRAVGTCLAFLNLMHMRTAANYGQFLVSGDPAAVAQQLIPSVPNTLAVIAKVDTVNRIPVSTFIASSMASGYNDMTAMVVNDIREAVAEQTQQQDLQKMKDFFGTTIPNIQSANTVDEAIGAIGNYITAQQAEITQLNGIISGLQTTINNLNTLLVTANNQIQQLGAAAQITLGKIGGAADAAKSLAYTGAGFLIGGPVGAALGFVFSLF